MNKSLILLGTLLGLLYLSQAVPVRLSNACLDCPPFDLIVEDRIVHSNVPYQKLTGNVLHWPGTRRMEIRESGTMNRLAPPFDIYLNMENPITINVINWWDNKTANYWVNYDWAGLGPEFGQIAIKAVNLSPNIGAIEVLDEDGNVIISNLCFPGRSDYVYLGYGAHQFTFRRVSNKEVLLTTDSKYLDNWTVNSLFFYGDVVAKDYHVNFVTDEFHGYDLDLDGPNRVFTNPQIASTNAQLFCGNTEV